MERIEFTSDDWDYMMKMNPDLRQEHARMLEFNAINPILAEEIDKKMREIRRKWRR